MNTKVPNPKLLTRTGLLARNTGLNIVGQVVPMLVTVFTLPYVIKGLGIDRFGIYSLGWVVLGYFSFFDFGMGRATTKVLAETLGKGDTERVPAIVWASFVLITITSLLGAVILLSLTPILVEKVLNVPANLMKEAKTVFFILSAFIVISLITSVFNGILEAYQRFDIINKIKIPSAILSSIIPVIAISFGADLPTIVSTLTVMNLFTLFIFAFSSLQLVFQNKNVIYKLAIKSDIARALFNFGKWMTVIGILTGLILHLDRFLIGSLLSVRDVGYYTPPYSIVSKYWIFPMSMCMTLFPAFSAIGMNQIGYIEHLTARASKYLILSLGVLTLIILFFGHGILLFWLGNEFAENSTRVFQILAIGFFLNAQAWIPSTLLQGIGRVDLVAKIFLFVLPLHVALLYWLLGRMGIEGAALSWALRGTLELLLFYAVSCKVMGFNLFAFLGNGIIGGVIALGGLGLAFVLVTATINTNWLWETVGAIVSLLLFGIVVWHFVLDINERTSIVKCITIWGEQN